MKKLIFVLSIILSHELWAQNSAQNNSNVLNFEEDVIQGERKSPNIFVQLDVGKPNLDTVLFFRNNFNDYHSVDKDRRPSYRKVK